MTVQGDRTEQAGWGSETSRLATAKPDVRARVLRAAMSAVAEFGPDRVRIADVAERAGMSSGHLMYYYGRRDRILVDTLLISESDLAAERDRRIARAADARSAVEALVRMYLPRGRRDLRWTLWAQFLASPPQDKATQERFAAIVDSWSACLAAVIERGVAAGDFRCDDPADAAYRACRVMDGLSMEVLLGARGRTRDWAVRTAMAAIERDVDRR